MILAQKLRTNFLNLMQSPVYSPVNSADVVKNADIAEICPNHKGFYYVCLTAVVLKGKHTAISQLLCVKRNDLSVKVI